VLVYVGADAAGVLGGAWYEFAVAPRRTSSGHAIYVCATGAVGTCAPRFEARPQISKFAAIPGDKCSREISLEGASGCALALPGAQIL
jgi:hypothetical protein